MNRITALKNPLLELVDRLDFNDEKSLKEVLFVFRQFVAPYKNAKNIVESIEIKRKYSLMREIILGFYWLIELRLDVLIEARIDILIGSEQNMRQFIAENFNLREKIKLCNLLLIKRIDFNTIRYLAKVRDCFAHNIPLSDKRYLLNRKHIILNSACTKVFLRKIAIASSNVAKLFVDYRKIIKK